MTKLCLILMENQKLIWNRVKPQQNQIENGISKLALWFVLYVLSTQCVEIR